jgi:hypothetical protein
MQTPKTLAILSAIAFSLATGSAAAGPDWSTIERARAEKQTGKTKNAGGSEVGSKRVGYSYGPRAPYQPAQSVTPHVVDLPATKGMAGPLKD